MSRRFAKLVFLCEDKQHEAFLRRFFEQKGWSSRKFRIERSPHGRGAGEQFVRERFPKELQAIRTRSVTAKLVVMLDADRSSVSEKIKELHDACLSVSIAACRESDPVAFFVPRRNIETWIAYLTGDIVNEEDVYRKLPRERDCAEGVKALREMCDAGALRSPAPPSLTYSCDAYRRIFC
jgi:hypothetical protein